jgi:hypothetical protein
MTTRTAFRPQILLNNASVTSFLNGENEAAQIARYTHAPPSRKPQQSSELPYLVSHILLPLAHYLLRLICFSDLAKKVWVMSRHAIDDATAIKTQKIFQQNLLGRSINTHRKDTEDYYLQHPMRVPFATYNEKNLEFFHKNGICKGMCYWFAFLYFKTKDRFTDPQQHIRAVTEQFAKGAPRQAAFLQSLKPASIYELLRLNVQEDSSKVSVAGKTRDQICRELQFRAPGVYGIITTSPHFVIYVKVDDNHEYLFEPNKGSINISTPELFKKAMDRYFDTHDSTKEISVDCLTPR